MWLYSTLCENKQPAVPKKPYNSSGSLINKIARLQARWLEPRLQPLGLTTAQLPVIAVLREGSTTQKELALQLQVEQPTMAQLLQRMERDGLIKRKPDARDGRSSLVELTSLALRRAEPALKLLEQGRQELLKGFDEGELTALNTLLSKIVDNLENAVLERRGGPETTKR